MMKTYSPDKVFASDAVLRSLLKTCETPFFLYDERSLRAAIRSLYAAFSWNSGFLELFPVRYAPFREILKIFCEEGCGVFCDNAHELSLARSSGFPDERIVCTPFPESEGLLLLLDGAYARPPMPPAHALLCVHPGGRLFYRRHPVLPLDRIRTGMPESELLTLASQLRLFGTKTLGVAFQGLTNSNHPEYYPAVAQLVFQTALHVYEKTGHAPEYVCLGDGLGVPTPTGEPAPDLSLCAQQIHALFSALPGALCKMRLLTMLGRRMIAPHALLLTSVRTVKERERPLLITDLASAQAPDCCAPTGHRHISVLGNSAAEGRVLCDIASCQTEPYGFLGERCALPPVRPGEVLLVHTAGAAPAGYTPVSGFPPLPIFLLRQNGSVDRLEYTFPDFQCRA